MDARNDDGQRAPAVYGEMKVICDQEGITLHTSVRYSPESNGVANERSELPDSSLPKSCGQKGSTPRRMYIIGNNEGIGRSYAI